MKLRTLLLICAAIIVIGGGLVWWLVFRGTNTGSVALADVRATSNAGRKCLGSNDNFKLSGQDQQAIAAAVTGYIRDVPAGTQASIDVNKYEKGNSVTGKLVYEKDFGAYNFELKPRQREKPNEQVWSVAVFEACDK